MATASSTLLRAARVIDGKSDLPLQNHSVLVRGDRIGGIFSGGKEPPADTVIDCTGMTVLPGLIDAHVHLAFRSVPDRLRYQVTASPMLKAFYAAKHAKLTLDAGFTTVRTMGGEECMAVKQAIEAGVIEGPRLLVSGIVDMTCGHIDLIRHPALPRAPEDTADGVWEVRKRVRQHVRNGADFIKICTSGGVTSAIDEPDWRNYTLEEIMAITDEAHAIGRRVAAHAHGNLGIKNAVRGGVDTIEHGIFLDEEAIDMMLKAGSYLVPTLTVGHAEMVRGRESGLSEHALEKAHRVHPIRLRSVRMACDAGVKIVCGTDTASIALHGENAKELELLMQDGGLTAMQAIRAATSMAAEAIAMSDRIGTIEPGKYADLLVIDGDPLSDIRVFQDRGRIKAVYKGGKIIAPTPLPERIIW
ncbi:MAG: amidohydrolase family protein [Burkholderiales bacterium]|nr:amidohydrolase family protein [Burkholderiales bacterium]